MKQKFRFPDPSSLFGFSSASANHAWLAAIIQSSNDAIISKSLSGIVSSWNPAAAKVFGFSATEMIGSSIRKIVPDDLQSEEDEILAAIKRGEQIEQFETRRLHKKGHEVPISVSISPIFDEDGKIIGASKIARDITQELEARRQIDESEGRFKTLADNMSQLAWMADENGWIFWYNKRWYEYTGTTLEGMEGWGWRSVHHPDHVDRVTERIQHSFTTGEVWEDTFPLRSKSGEYRWFLSRARPVRDMDGNIIRWFGTNTDITEERERQEKIRFLMGEVNHRSKNMLALVQSIARYTGRHGQENFLEKFSERLQALASSHDLLLEGGWKGMTIDKLIESQLGHVSDLTDDRIRFQGPPVYVDPKASQPLGMALHELATNASKYGALSNDDGRVDISWEFISVDGAVSPGLKIVWQETGGPEVKQPERRGFGSLVIDRMCRMAFAGEVELDFRPEGLRWTLRGGAGAGMVALTGDSPAVD